MSSSSLSALRSLILRHALSSELHKGSQTARSIQSSTKDIPLSPDLYASATTLGLLPRSDSLSLVDLLHLIRAHFPRETHCLRDQNGALSQGRWSLAKGLLLKRAVKVVLEERGGRGEGAAAVAWGCAEEHGGTMMAELDEIVVSGVAGAEGAAAWLVAGTNARYRARHVRSVAEEVVSAGSLAHPLLAHVATACLVVVHSVSKNKDALKEAVRAIPKQPSPYAVPTAALVAWCCPDLGPSSSSSGNGGGLITKGASLFASSSLSGSTAGDLDTLVAVLSEAGRLDPVAVARPFAEMGLVRSVAEIARASEQLGIIDEADAGSFEALHLLSLTRSGAAPAALARAKSLLRDSPAAFSAVHLESALAGPVIDAANLREALELLEVAMEAGVRSEAASACVVGSLLAAGKVRTARLLMEKVAPGGFAECAGSDALRAACIRLGGVAEAEVREVLASGRGAAAVAALERVGDEDAFWRARAASDGSTQPLLDQAFLAGCRARGDNARALSLLERAQAPGAAPWHRPTLASLTILLSCCSTPAEAQAVLDTFQARFGMPPTPEGVARLSARLIDQGHVDEALQIVKTYDLSLIPEEEMVMDAGVAAEPGVSPTLEAAKALASKANVDAVEKLAKAVIRSGRQVNSALFTEMARAAMNAKDYPHARDVTTRARRAGITLQDRDLVKAIQESPQ